MFPTTWGDTGLYLDPKEFDGQIGEIISLSGKPQSLVDLHVFVGLPNEFVHDWGIQAKRTIGVTAGVEATQCNRMWVSCINAPAINATIVPSKFTKSTLVKGGAHSYKLHVIPEAYVPQCDENHSFELSEVPDENILFVSQISMNPKADRKNFMNSMDALARGIKGTDVGLVLKLNSSGRGSLDRMNTREYLKDLKKEFGITNPITLVHGELNNEELVGLYKHPKISLMFSMTRGEGFGLPLLEAAACGLPVMASDWSAHPEFLDHKFLKLKGREVPIPPERIDPNIWVGGNWFDPSVIKASKSIKKFFGDSQFRKTAMDNASSLQKIVISRYSITEMCNKFDEKIEEILRK